MIFTNCECGKPYTIDYECGDELGFNRVNCECGLILMIERLSFGDTHIFENEEDLKEFIKEKGLTKNK